MQNQEKILGKINPEAVVLEANKSLTHGFSATYSLASLLDQGVSGARDSDEHARELLADARRSRTAHMVAPFDLDS